MARFTDLLHDKNYDVIHPETGEYMTQGIQGGDLMWANDWPDGAGAHEAGVLAYDPEDQDGDDEPVPVAIAK